MKTFRLGLLGIAFAAVSMSSICIAEEDNTVAHIDIPEIGRSGVIVNIDPMALPDEILGHIDIPEIGQNANFILIPLDQVGHSDVPDLPYTEDDGTPHSDVPDLP